MKLSVKLLVLILLVVYCVDFFLFKFLPEPELMVFALFPLGVLILLLRGMKLSVKLLVLIPLVVSGVNFFLFKFLPREAELMLYALFPLEVIILIFLKGFLGRPWWLKVLSLLASMAIAAGSAFFSGLFVFFIDFAGAYESVKFEGALFWMCAWFYGLMILFIPVAGLVLRNYKKMFTQP